MNRTVPDRTGPDRRPRPKQHQQKSGPHRKKNNNQLLVFTSRFGNIGQTISKENKKKSSQPRRSYCMKLAND